MLVLSGAIMASCGGGGGASSPPVHPATTYRANNVGDSWTYNVNIDFGIFGKSTGTLVQALSSDTYNGQPSIRDSQAFHLQTPSGPSSTYSYSEISPQGVLLAVMVNTVLYGVTDNTYSTGNTIDASTSASGVITLSNSSTLTEHFKVLGAEYCVTPAGTFACWVAEQTVVNSDGTSDRFTMWIDPSVGTYVKITDTTKNPGNVGYTYTSILASMVTAPVRQKKLGQPFIRQPHLDLR